MRAIERVLPPDDGVVAFTFLYRSVTEAVGNAALVKAFHDVRFLRRLDVVFANLYLRALRDEILARRSSVPRAWRPLFEARGRSGIAPIQFALAGMNAHINRDLPIAVVATCEAADIEPRRPSPQYDDFTRVNDLLATTEEAVKERFAVGLVGVAADVLGRLDDVVAMWNVAHAREAAWVNAETLWALRGVPRLREEYLLALDRMVGFAGRGLVAPTGLPE